jgi:hypothetical protein
MESGRLRVEESWKQSRKKGEGVVRGWGIFLLCACAHQGLQPRETFTEQARSGAALYRANCSNCHGAEGQGSEKAPRLVGVGRAERSAIDEARFVARHAPHIDVWPVVAFELKANGIDLGAQTLDASSASRTGMP